MKISTRGRYGLRLMLDLAQNGGDRPVPLKDVAERQEVTLKYMEQLISPLLKAGLVTSTRGIGGGYRLTRTPEEYSCGEILRAEEGSLSPTLCADAEGDQECPRIDRCPTIHFWKGLSDVITEYVDGVTLADLMRDAAAMEE